MERTSKSDRENKVVFAYAKGEGGSNVVILGVSKAAWDYMKDGKTHQFDLTKIGIPLQLMMFGAESYDDARSTMDACMKASNSAYLDETRRDFSIEPRGDKQNG